MFFPAILFVKFQLYLSGSVSWVVIAENLMLSIKVQNINLNDINHLKIILKMNLNKPEVVHLKTNMIMNKCKALM